MPQHPTPEYAADPSQSVKEAQIEDLRRRIETLEALDESEFGEFNRRDWVLCTLGALVIPTLVLIWIGRFRSGLHPRRTAVS